MKTTIRLAIASFAVASLAIAASPKMSRRLTPQRLAELTGVSDAPQAKRFNIEVSGLARPGATRYESATAPNPASGPIHVTLSADHPQGVIEVIREFRFPVAFDLPQATGKGEPGIIPMTPTAFETVNTGWTIHLSAKRNGKLVALYGVADYVTADLVAGGYGAVAEPIYSEDGKLISPNALDQPKFQTTTTRFHIFAVPGEPTEVTLYRGSKSGKHIVTVTNE